jgi:hypothetical protein
MSKFECDGGTSMFRAQIACCCLMFAGLVIGCSPSTKDAGPAKPEPAAPKAGVADDAQIARILRLLDEQANAIEAVAAEIRKIVDDDSAMAAGKELKKHAERIRGLYLFSASS